MRHAHVGFKNQPSICRTRIRGWGCLPIFRQVFDSVVWAALNMAQIHFMFGPYFRCWIQVLYLGKLVLLMYNGIPLTPSEIFARIHQTNLYRRHCSWYLLSLCYISYGSAQYRAHKCFFAHHVISFASDCTITLHHLRHTEKFLLGYMDRFC